MTRLDGAFPIAFRHPIASRAGRFTCYGLAMRRTPASLLPVTLALSLTACAAARDYPSLERRSAERMTGSARPVAPEAPLPPPPAPSTTLTGRLAQLVTQARAADQRFSAKRANANRLVAAASGGAPGSEAWSVATVALSDLESSRSDAMIALAELDRLYVDEAIAAAETGNPAGVDAITAARDRVTALVRTQDTALVGLRSRMRG